MEEQKKSTRNRKLIAALCSLVLCMLLIGVSVYAALSQSATITNTITVTTSGQVKTSVVVKEYAGEGAEAVAAVPGAPTFVTEVLNKGAEVDNLTEAATPFVFSSADGKNFYAYEITFANTSTKEVTAKITSSTESNEEIDVYAGETWEGMTKLENTKGVDGTVVLAASTGSGTYYIMVCANKALGEMTAAVATDFNVSIVIE
ncbi:MAG: SipW-dependent-type signal peptide-containing protein [Christensenellales bacterium]